MDFSGRLSGEQTVNGFDRQALIERLDTFFKEYLPFDYSSDGDIDYMLFESDGEKYVCFLNHNGITKDVEKVSV